MWKAKVFSKVKYFVWRLIQGIILTKESFVKKGLNISNICAVCERVGKDIRHVFLVQLQPSCLEFMCTKFYLGLAGSLGEGRDVGYNP